MKDTATMSKPTPKSKAAPKASSRRKTTAADPTTRKRELDRIAQRNCRERTKNRINFLEEKLRSLEARDRNSQFSNLAAMQETLLNDNSELRAAMRKILFIAESVLNTSKNISCEKCKARSSSSETIGSPEDAVEEVEQRRASAESLDDFLDIQQQTYPQTPNFTSTVQPSLDLDDQSPCDEIPLNQRPVDNVFVENEFFTDDAMTLDRMVSCNAFIDSELLLTPSPANFDSELANWQNMSFCYNVPSLFGVSNSGVVPHEKMWTFCDGTFVHGLEMTRTEKLVDHDPLDPAVPIQAILWGWHTIDARTRNHPAWVALREVDEKVFGLWKSKPQKIALMYVCSLVMQYRASPTPENLERIPSWLRPRPSQERLEHPLVIDFLIWPGLRDVLVFNHTAYTQTGEFSQRFTEDFHFNWPFPETSIFEFDPVSGQSSLSKLFRSYAFDLSNWTMDPRFFERYPELAHDIPMNMRKVLGARAGWLDGLGMGDGSMGIREVTEVML